MFAFAASALLGGCGLVPKESVSFEPSPRQEISSQDGSSLIVSRGRTTVVSMRPTEAQFTFDTGPSFIVGIQNASAQPIEFNLNNVSATEIINGRPTGKLKVYSDKELISEEETRRFGRELLASMLAGVSDGLGNDPSNGNAISSNAEQVHADRVNELQEIALVDHILQPGGTYAGKLEIDKPATTSAGMRRYSIAIKLGSDLHEIQIAQTQLPVQPIIQAPRLVIASPSSQ